MSWADLPKELLYIILKNLTNDIHNLPDLYQCLSVCSLWRDVAKELMLCSTELVSAPWLLNPWKEPNKVVFDTSLSDPHKKTNIASFRLPIDDNDHEYITYASHGGWLLVANRYASSVKAAAYSTSIDHPVLVYNPMSRVVIQLPPLPSPHQLNDFSKFVMSETSPTHPKCIICVSIKRLVLAFCKGCSSPPWSSSSSSSSWVLLKKPFSSCINVESVIFYRGDFYTIDDDGALFVLSGITDFILNDSSNTSRTWPWPGKENKVALSTYSNIYPHILYLVQSKNGELLMVERIIQGGWWNTKSFRVYQLTVRGSYKKKNWASDNNNFDYYWKDTNTLEENEALYLGWNDSISISVSDDHNSNTYKPNCIYFFHQPIAGERRSYGMYDMGSHRFKYWYKFNSKVEKAHHFFCRLFTPSILL